MLGRRSLSVSCPLSLCHRVRGVPLGMTRIHPERPDPAPFDHSMAAEVLLRQEPDDEEEEDEEEEEEEGDGKEDDDEDDDGYSE